MVLDIELDVVEVRDLWDDEHEVRHLDEEELHVEEYGLGLGAYHVGGVRGDVLKRITVVVGQVRVVEAEVVAHHGVHIALDSPETLLC